MRGLWRRFRVLFQREEFDRELEEEMECHRHMMAQAEVEAGASPQEASRQAAIQFGNTASLRETSRDAWGWGPVERVVQDLRYGVKVLRKNPGFTLVALLVLALGIGASTAAFSMMQVLMVNPLPFPGADRIVYVDARHISRNNSGTGYRDFLDWREQNTVFEEMAIFPWASAYTLSAEGEPERVKVARTTPGFDRVLAFRPALGRFFSAGEDRIGGPPVVLISYAAWQQRYAGRADVLGRTVTLDGATHTIIGVLPDHFALRGIRTSEFWMPIREGPAADRLQHQYGVLARLKPGISIERAQADMTAIARRLERDYPRTNTGWGIAVTPVRPEVLGIDDRPFLVLIAAVFSVLLLACANIAGMLLARGSARAQEMTIRASLGAGRWRIMRQVLTESVLLALGGGVFGIAFATWLMGITRRVAPPDFALDASLRMNWYGILFAITLSMLTGTVFGLAPAWYAGRTNLAANLKSRSGLGSRNRVLSGIVAAEIALSMVLMVAASLLTKDLAMLIRSSIGIRIDHILTFALDLPQSGYREEKRPLFYQDLLARLRTIPGIEADGAVDTLPLTGSYSGGPFEIEGRPKPADWMAITSQYLTCTPGYLATVGIRILAGRGFDDRDTAKSQPVAVISEPLARRYFAGENPVGHRIKYWDGWRTIIGVVGPVKQFNRAQAAHPQIYIPATQSTNGTYWIVVRTASDPAAVARLARDAVHELDRNLPLIHLATMQDMQYESLSEERIVVWCLGALAGFALLIGAIGIYGVIAWSVSRRTFEIGVRVAVGASYTDILTMVLRNGLFLAGCGVLVGLPLALLAGKLLASLLYGVSSHDAVVFLAVPVILTSVAALASFLPARRAARLDPTTALRVE
jgi:putative ABC transport system permease protein